MLIIYTADNAITPPIMVDIAGCSFNISQLNSMALKGTRNINELAFPLPSRLEA